MVKLNLSPTQQLKLKQFLNNPTESDFCFLDFCLNLNTGEFHDVLQEEASVAVVEVKDPTMHAQIAELLATYSQANKTAPSGNLKKFKDFPGGYAYENAFTKRAVEPIAKTFGKSPEGLLKAAELIGGKSLSLGQSSTQITALPYIPLTYILWTDEELPPSANVLFDESASNYFNVEDLAKLAEITTWRLSVACSILKKK
jgi:hypothetical protein